MLFIVCSAPFSSLQLPAVRGVLLPCLLPAPKAAFFPAKLDDGRGRAGRGRGGAGEEQGGHSLGSVLTSGGAGRQSFVVLQGNGIPAG